ncbi:MAG: sugar transferase [Bryobacteraceae bacterium]|nr:sugar transferase [Bryobacteraceae bacterium]
MPWWKRATDLTLVWIALLFLGPLMLLAAILIKLSSRGPVFYVAPRMGHRGVPFGQLKFRTMHVGADRQGAFTAQQDRRVFPVGRWLRLFKIDELPQILNILRGEMSVVGPRPEDISTVERCYSPEQRQVLEAVPGLTGLVQVRFFPELSVVDPGGMDPQEHYQRVILPMRLEMDFEYIRRQSFWFDAGLILQTIYLILVKAPALALGMAPRKVELSRV